MTTATDLLHHPLMECRLWSQHLSRVHTSNNVEATLSNAARRTIISTKSKQIEHVQFVSTLSKGRHFTIKSFNIVAVFGNKVDRCFDIVAGVDGALVGQISSSVTDHLAQMTHISLPLPRSRMVQSSIFHFGLTFLSPSFSVPAFQRPHHFVW